MRYLTYLILTLITMTSLQGCVAIAVADLAATAVVKTAGLAVDATVGTAKFVGRAIVPGSDDDKPSIAPNKPSE